MDVRYLSAKHFHQKEIVDAFDNFENKETTVSHHFRKPHPFLQNQSYGQAFFNAVQKRVHKFNQVLEVGGGRGDLARDFINTWKNKPSKKQKSYTILDLSSKFLSSQRKQITPGKVLVNFVQGDAEIFPFKKESLSGIIIANEMIADLDAWLITKKNKKSKGPHCIGDKNKHFSPKLIHQTLRHYRFNRWLSNNNIIFPFGLALFLESLHNAMKSGTSAFISEYFDLHKGGSVVHLHKHTESSLNLDLVCMLARRIGFSVKVESLSKFLDLQITFPVMTKQFSKFLRDVLKLNYSTTLPYGINEVQQLARATKANSYQGFFSESELNNFISDFYILILTKQQSIKPKEWSSNLVMKKDPAAIILKSHSKQSYLVMSHPFSHCKINSTGEFIWKQINGIRSISCIAKVLSQNYKISNKQALIDTLNFMHKLYRHYFIC